MDVTTGRQVLVKEMGACALMRVEGPAMAGMRPALYGNLPSR